MKLFVVVVAVCFCFGRAGERVSFGVAAVVAVVCFCFGGRWRFGVGCETVRRRRRRLFFCFGRAGERVSFGVAVAVVAVVVVCFCFGGTGASQLPGCVQTGYALSVFSRRAGWCL